MLITSLISIFPLLAISIALMGLGAYLLFSSVTPSNWPIAEGTITKSGLQFETEGGENTEIMKCEPEVNFEYQIEDRKLSGAKISFSKKPIDRAEAQDIIDAYPVGEKVEVFYSPKNPEIAVLETPTNNTAYAVIGTGLLVGLIPLIKVLLSA